MDRFFIGPQAQGLVNNLLPWAIPDNAYAELNNCYVWRGRIKKRFGSQWIENTQDPNNSRLRANIGTITETSPGVYTLSVTVPGAIWKIGQQFSVGTTVLTAVIANGALLTTGTITGTYNTANGALVITGAIGDIGSIVYFYPVEPGMGTNLYDIDTANLSFTIAFDTQFAYEYDLTSASFQRLGTAVWTGNDDQFFWSITWRNTNTFNTADNINLFFATNFNDPVRYWDQTTWNPYQPLLYGSTTLDTARLVVAYKGRMVFLNTVEGGQSFVNRARISWTQSLIGDVVDPQGNTIPAINNAFFEASGKGSYLDAPVSEAIISAQIIKDRLIVFFEESTYQLTYTGSPDLPLVWQKIDNSLGALSSLGLVSFNNVVIGFGKDAIISCNGAQVSRLDEKIPESVFQIEGSLSQFERVSGIRDFKEENVYWTFPSIGNNSNFPGRVLVYDYVHDNWSFNDDSFTVFGYHYQQTGLIWAKWHTRWEDSHWQWQDGETAQSFKSVIAINQEGYVVQIVNNLPTNAPALSITNILGTTITCINHNLNQGDFIQISRCIGSTNLNGQIVQVLLDVDDDTFTISLPADAGYVGGGIIARVSRISIKTKDFNFYTKTGQNTSIPYVEFFVDNEGRGEDNPNPVPIPPPYTTPAYDPDINRPRIKVDYFISSSSLSMVNQGNQSGSALGVSGGNILDLFPYKENPNLDSIEVSQERFWKRVYFQAEGQTVQLRIYWDDNMMYNENQSLSDFVLHALLVYAIPRGTRFNG